MRVTKSENKVYQLFGPPGQFRSSNKMYPDLVLDIQDLLLLALDVLACPRGLTQTFNMLKQKQEEQGQEEVFEPVYKRGQSYTQILKLREVLSYLYPNDPKLVCAQPCNLRPKQAFVRIYMLN